MAKPKTTKKPVPKKPTRGPRKLKQSNYKSFKMTRRIKNVRPKLPNGLKLFKQSTQVLKANWRLFVGISLVYGLLALVLVRGLTAGSNFTDLKTAVKDTFSGKFGGVATSAVLFSYLIGSTSSSSSESGGVYQVILIIIASLAIIWALRQVLANKKIKARDAYYRGVYPFVPFVLVLIVIGLQLIPLLAGSWLYGTVISNGIAVTALEKVMWGVFFLLMATLSLYMVASSLFALYIVTLPDMTPMRALTRRGAWQNPSCEAMTFMIGYNARKNRATQRSVYRDTLSE